jgi:ABC-type nitrate/sulfonate/bicarbonate transport system substrate-binding protein
VHISVDPVRAFIVPRLRPLVLLLASYALFTFARTVDAQTARISYGGTSGYNVPVWVTYDAGLFKKYGLNAEAIFISGDAPSMQAMLANETQFNNATGASSISAGLQGADPVIIATSYDRMPYAFVVHKDIGSPADLKGKRIVITRFGGVTEFAVKIALEKFGLTPKDVSMIQGGPDAQRIPAVLSGAVAASVLAPPGLFAATAQGAKTLVDLGDLGTKYPTSTIIVMRAYLSQNRATVKSFLMAFIEGLHLYATDRDLTIRVMQRYTKLKDPLILSKSHDYFVKRTLLVPLTDPAAIKNALPEKAIGRRPEEFYDNSLIQELVTDGFVERITKRR